MSTRRTGRSPGGLSPRLRGLRPAPRPTCRALRSIPASAGPATPNTPRKSRCMVYPRVCGACWGEHPPGVINIGLSPRLRGLRVGPGGEALRGRSIPASAGPAATQALRAWPPAVYPRVCGACMSRNPGVPSTSGLFPRLRGLRCAVQQLPRVQRSIPASAGPAAALVRQRPGARGLSPRLRGLSVQNLCPGGQVRSIPASAGHAAAPITILTSARVYPRVCGACAPRWSFP